MDRQHKPTMTSPKSDHIILDIEQVAARVKEFRSQGKKIVLTQGSFDMVHVGHARYCAQAKIFGDVLIMGVDSDEKVRERKGPDRPVVPQEERLEMLMYFSSVDLVVLKPLIAPKYQLIKLVRPDVLVATRETYSPAKIIELEKFCGRVEVLEPMATTSTSAKIRRLQIGLAKQMSTILSTRLMKTIEDVLSELKGEV